MSKEIHKPELKGTIYEGREAVHAIEFKPEGTFKAISAAETYLEELGYLTGSMNRDKPIGFAYNASYVAKWSNLNHTDIQKLDGIIIPQDEFREGGALIIFFTIPRY